MKKSTPTNRDTALKNLAHTYYRPEQPRQVNALQTEPASKRFGWKAALLVFLLLAIVSVLFIVGWNIRNFTSASQKLFGTSNVLAMLPPMPIEQTQQHRVNILVVGFSADNPGHQGAELTDSIILVSVDTKTKDGYMLSVPRDLYVDIPTYRQAKINEAYQGGERSDFTDPQYPDGGMGLLRKTVSEVFGVEIHYHVLVNYAAVRDTVDALGGIEVNIQSSDERGLYDANFQLEEGGPLQLPNGVQTIDGETALKLTRARGASGDAYGFAESDFARTRHQQLVLAGITRELSWTLLLDPRTNGQIFAAIGDNVQTDIEIQEVIPFARLFIGIPTDQLRSVTLRDVNGQNLLQSYRTSSGQAALIPADGMNMYDAIQSAIDALGNE